MSKTAKLDEKIVSLSENKARFKSEKVNEEKEASTVTETMKEEDLSTVKTEESLYSQPSQETTEKETEESTEIDDEKEKEKTIDEVISREKKDIHLDDLELLVLKRAMLTISNLFEKFQKDFPEVYNDENDKIQNLTERFSVLSSWFMTLFLKKDIDTHQFVNYAILTHGTLSGMFSDLGVSVKQYNKIIRENGDSRTRKMSRFNQDDGLDTAIEETLKTLSEHDTKSIVESLAKMFGDSDLHNCEECKAYDECDLEIKKPLSKDKTDTKETNVDSSDIKDKVVDSKENSKENPMYILPMAEVDSSNLSKVGYNGTDLIIEFDGSGAYFYEDVPVEIVYEMLKSDSMGKYLNQNIKGTYEFFKGQPSPGKCTKCDKDLITVEKIGGKEAYKIEICDDCLTKFKASSKPLATDAIKH